MRQRKPNKPGSKGSRIPTPGAGEGKNGGHEDDDEEETDVSGSDGIGQILAQLTRIDTKFDDFKLEMREGLHSTEFKINEVSDKLETQVVKTVEASEKMQVMSETTEGLKTRSTVHGLRITELEMKIEQLEKDKRKNIIIVEGVPESEGKPSPEVIEELFTDLKVNYDTLVCDRIYRRGKVPSGPSEGEEPEVAAARINKRAPTRHRPIVVGIKRFDEKIQVFKHLRNLQGLEKWSKVFINDDLTEMQLRQNRDLRALAAYAKGIGYNAVVRANFLVIDKRRFSYGELHKLPQDLSLEKAKTVECLDGKGVAFQSVHSPLSNLYPCNIVFKGKPFLSAEGALQHTRAVFCRRLLEARKIEYERDAYEVKRISATFRHPQEWEDKVPEVLLDILIIKFTDNTHCKEVLLATGNRRLFEATGDKTWACGLPLARIHELTLPPPGKNRTGETVEKVRELLKGK